MKHEKEIINEAEIKYFGSIEDDIYHITFRSGVVAGRATIHNKDYAAALYKFLETTSNNNDPTGIPLKQEWVPATIERLNRALHDIA